MIWLAKRMGRAAFGIGMAIGILVAGALTPAVKARMMPSPAPAPEGSCVEVGGQPQEVIDYANLLCQVHQALFNDGSLPGTGFAFDKDITQQGGFEGQSWDNRPIKFNVVSVVDIDLKTNAPSIAALGATAHWVVGTLWGPAGSVPITGMIIYTKGIASQAGYFLSVSSVLSVTELDAYAQEARLRAGVRMLDVNTFKSYPLSDVVSVDALSASGGDVATLYGTGVNAPDAPQVSKDNADCIKEAYELYEADVKGADDVRGICLAAAFASWAILAAACEPFVLAMGWGYLICLASVSAAFLIACAACELVYRSSVNTAMDKLKIRLRHCGVNLMDV